METSYNVPDGTHEARIVSIALVGTIEGQFTDKKTKQVKKTKRTTVLISFEMTEHSRDTIEGPINKIVSKDYTLSYGERATLRKDIEAILGRSLTDDEVDYSNKSGMYRITDLLGKACFVTVQNETWEYKDKSGINCKIKSVSAIPKKYLDAVPDAQRVLTSFDIRRFHKLYDLQNDKSYRMQNKFVKGKIHKSLEYKKLSESVDTTEGLQKNIF